MLKPTIVDKNWNVYA